MNQLKQSTAIRVLSYVLVVAFVSGVTGFRYASPAAAQVQVAQTYSVGVVDFVNDSGVQGDILGRMATDAVVLEMSKTNRYDVGITRSQIKAEMDKLDLRPPLSSVGLSKLGEALSVDAMLRGAIKKVTYSGQGSSRSCSVVLAVEMIDQASGETINGAVQTGTSSARVGYTADDDTLLAEAINNAAYLCVRTIMTYVIPEATIMINIQADQVMIDRGARHGIKQGMKMIVLRNKQIVGYIQVYEVSAIDAKAKVIRFFQGLQPEDKVRAIFELPTVVAKERKEPLPAGPPGAGTRRTDTIKKIAKWVLGVAIVVAIGYAFRDRRGQERAPSVGTLDESNTIITWDVAKMNHGIGVSDLQILRDDFAITASPVVAIREPSIFDSGRFDVRSLYGTAVDTPVQFFSIDTSPSTTAPTTKTFNVPAEAFGVTHTYQARMLYTTKVAVTPQWLYSIVSNNIITITAIEPVRAADLIFPPFDPSSTAPSILLNELTDGTINFRWNRKAGANVYFMTVEPIVPGTIATFDSRTVGGVIFETGPTVELTPAQRTNLADFLSRSRITPDTVLRWRVFCRNTADTSPAFTAGEEGRFTVGELPPPIP